jgi:hypothetical protein
VIRFGKSAQDVLGFKQDFFTSNDCLRDNLLRINRLYEAQPRRTRCKLCDGDLAGKSRFKSGGVEYIICSRCGHLNGAHEDSDEFCAAVYSDDDGRDYAKTYHSTGRDDYFRRVEQIYTPKAKFLIEALREEGIDAFQASYADLGAGSGYFVAALQACGLRKVEGHEVSTAQVELAADMLSGRFVQHHELDALDAVIKELRSGVVSMIGVLEHVRYPRDVLSRLKTNPNVKYLYLSVPLFSISPYLEMVFPGVMPRHLAAAHTHLFTDSSLQWMAGEFGMTRVAEWWFGADVMDLFRSIAIMLEKSDETRLMTGLWQKTFAPLLDELQLVIDRRKQSSEVHALFRFDR